MERGCHAVSEDEYLERESRLHVEYVRKSLTRRFGAIGEPDLDALLNVGLVKLWAKYSLPIKRFRALWLKICANHLTDEIRRRKHVPEALGYALDENVRFSMPHRALSSPESAALVKDIILIMESLSERHQKIIQLLVTSNGKATARSIAQELGFGEAVAAKAIPEAKAALRERLVREGVIES